MKCQYLGDSKDSFKWDYHHFLVESLAYRQLKIVWMMTADDDSPNGRTVPELFPARPEILRLCTLLKQTRNPELLFSLPDTMGAQYTVSMRAADNGSEAKPGSLLAGLKAESSQVLFLDPDNGFEPERSVTDRHIRYADIDRLIKETPSDTVVSVFQHHRRKKFPDDFARIRERLLNDYSTAIYWRSVMFVNLCSSAETLHRVIEINREYAKSRPVNVID